MEIRKTTLADIPEIMEIYTIARGFMCKTEGSKSYFSIERVKIRPIK